MKCDETPSREQPWYAAGDPWVLTQRAWEPERSLYYETIFTQSNGYMGLRGYTEEVNAGTKSHREGYLAGVFGHIDDPALKQISVKYPWPMMQMVTLPELFACAVELNGERFRLSEGSVELFTRSLNLRHGVLSRHVEWISPSGHRTRLHFERFLSAAVPHLAAQQVTLTAMNWSGPARLEFELDGATPAWFRCGDRSLPHLRQDILLNPRMDIDRSGVDVLTVDVRGTGHTVAVASALAGAGRVAREARGAALRQSVDLSLSEGQASVTLHAVAVASSRDGLAPAEVTQVVTEIAQEAASAGYDAALAESEAVWEHRWGISDVALDGPARDQAYVRFSVFSMLQMAPFHTDNMSVPARAYAFNRYHGLYYWDSETFLLPIYLHTHPEVAENLLSFRHRTLPGARRTALHLQAPGACYPWMTDSDEGNEQAPWGIGDYVWHQNADIAYAIDQYVRATGDTRFMLEKGLEVMVESARFWMSRLEEDASGIVHLHNTVGPDELDRHGKDNGYTSLLARRHLRLTARWLDEMRAEFPLDARTIGERLELRPGEVAAWVHAADRLAVPNVPGHDFPLQDEFLLAKKPLSFEGLTADQAYEMRHTHRVVKQADIVLAMYLLQDEFTVEQMRHAYDFYEPMCLHYSSLSYNTHSILATKIGRERQAYDYFMKAAGLDLDDLREATKDGLHAAALGGTWQTLVFGFLGMRIEGDCIHFEPRLPAAWKAVSLHVLFRGYRLKLRFSRRGHNVEVDGTEGRGLANLVIDGEKHRLSDGLVVMCDSGLLDTTA